MLFLKAENRLCFHGAVSVGCEQPTQQQLVLAAVGVRFFRVVADVRAWDTLVFVLFSVRNLTL